MEENTPNLNSVYLSIYKIRKRISGEKSAENLLPYCADSFDEYIADILRLNEAIESFSRAVDSGESLEEVAIIAGRVASDGALLEHSFSLLRSELIDLVKALPEVKDE